MPRKAKNRRQVPKKNGALSKKRKGAIALQLIVGYDFRMNPTKFRDELRFVAEREAGITEAEFEFFLQEVLWLSEQRFSPDYPG